MLHKFLNNHHVNPPELHTYKVCDLLTPIHFRWMTWVDSCTSASGSSHCTQFHFPPESTTSEVRDPPTPIPPDPTAQTNFSLQPSRVLAPPSSMFSQSDFSLYWKILCHAYLSNG
jgi:hypothetical protein